ncbi:MAG: endonuclease III [Endomicrobium sp.]|jgi:endonuclease-3|nr:endonuclease III [Endomicrobium sp.]
MLKNKKKYVLKIIKIFKSNPLEFVCPLKFSSPFELLVAVVLSAQCTDKRVNKITKNLFKRYKNIKDYANADIFELESYIISSGFFRNKAKNIIESAKLIISLYNGIVPNTMFELLKLPGVARKTANVVLSFAFNVIEGIVVDTHVIRIANLLHLTEHVNPVKIEKDLMNIVPRIHWKIFSFYIQNLGRTICKAKNPNHIICPLNKICHLKN